MTSGQSALNSLHNLAALLNTKTAKLDQLRQDEHEADTDLTEVINNVASNEARQEGHEDSTRSYVLSPEKRSRQQESVDECHVSQIFILIIKNEIKQSVKKYLSKFISYKFKGFKPGIYDNFIRRKSSNYSKHS